MENPESQHLRALLESRFKDGKRVVLSIEGFQRAGVLVPIVNSRGRYDFLFTKRTEHVETHKGQVSFPGGMVDQTDEGIVQTALREAREEVGISEQAIEIQGLLDDLATPTGFIITPVVGLIENLPPLAINTEEVAEAFRIPVGFFSDPKAGRRAVKEFRGEQREVWYYEYGAHTIWGATAIIVRSLLEKLSLL
jgi:8-oxo-dGTP pyrophosphatase MutT (NUDIX family)